MTFKTNNDTTSITRSSTNCDELKSAQAMPVSIYNPPAGELGKLILSKQFRLERRMRTTDIGEAVELLRAWGLIRNEIASACGPEERN